MARSRPGANSFLFYVRFVCILLAAALLCAPSLPGAGAAECCPVLVIVSDMEGNPVPRAAITLTNPHARVTAEAGEDGRAVLALPSPGTYALEAALEGHQPARRTLAIVAGRPLEIEVTLVPVVREAITVEAQVPILEGSPGAPTVVTRADVADLPARPATVRDALPLIPGITRNPQGKLRIGDSPEHRSALLLNALDVTDPATGDFGATVPIDVVAAMNVYKSPFLAEFGRFTAGVVAVDTRSGGDKWRWVLNDPTPEMRIRSRRLRGIRGFTPRLSAGGPLQPGRLYLSQALEYRVNKTPDFTLLFPHNEEKRELWNSLTQIDYVPSATHMLTVTLHGVPQRINFVRPNFYNPQPATPSFRGHEFRAGVTDRFTLGGGVLESALSLGQTTSKTAGQGDADFTLTPTRNTGNYFARHDRHAERFQWRQAYTTAPFGDRGTHQLKFGGTVIRTRSRGRFEFRPVNIRGLDGELLRRIEFANQDPFRLTDLASGLFVQDHWTVTRDFSLDAGIRADSESRTGLFKLAPRVGAAWTPPGGSGLVVRSGFGWFYDRVPLNVHAFGWYPEQILDPFAPDGPHHFANLVESAPGSPLIFGSSDPGNFAPRSRTWNVQLERRFQRLLHLRATYQESHSSGLVLLRPGCSPTGRDAVLLGGSGGAKQRRLEIVSRVSWQEEQQLFASYVRSWSRGNLNDFAGFLGDFPSPLVRPDVVTETPDNIPHRFLAWGAIPLPADTHLFPTFEYRTGIPYIVTDAAQEYVGTPNTRRFPNFFSLDMRLAKDIPYRNYTFRVSASAFNLTNHFNPNTVRLNVADPLFGQFLGHSKRRFRLDVDVFF